MRQTIPNLLVRRRFLGLVLLGFTAVGLRATASADQTHPDGSGARYVAHDYDDDDDDRRVFFGRRYSDSGRFWLPWISIERERYQPGYGYDPEPVPVTPHPAPLGRDDEDWDVPRFNGEMWDDEPAPPPLPMPPAGPRQPAAPPLPQSAATEVVRQPEPQTAEPRVPAAREAEYGPVMVVPPRGRTLVSVPLAAGDSSDDQPRPGQFAEERVPLYSRVRVRDAHNVAPQHVKAAVAVQDPNICPHPCRCHAPNFVFVEVLVPRWPARSVNVSDHGTRVALDYGAYRVEIRSHRGVVTIEYDD